MRTLFLHPPSYEDFDGGAGSRYQARREVRSCGLPSEPGHRGVYASHRWGTAQTPSGCCGSSTAGPSGRNEYQAATDEEQGVQWHASAAGSGG